MQRHSFWGNRWSLLIPLFILGSVAMGLGRVADRISVTSGNGQVFGVSESPQINANGRFVVFQSAASEFFPSDANGFTQIYLHDRESGETLRISQGAGGIPGNGNSIDASISADGARIVFVSEASNLSPGDSSGRDVFLYERNTRKVRRISENSNGTSANGESVEACISADGRFAAFASFASNLVSDDTNNAADIFIRNLQSSVVSRVSLNSAGGQIDGDCFSPRLSGDGDLVVFTSTARVEADTDNLSDVFVRQRSLGVTKRVSRPLVGTSGSGHSYQPSVSTDGRFVAFTSTAITLTNDPSPFTVERVFVWQQENGVITREASFAVNVHTPSISGDGSKLVMATEDALYLRERSIGQTGSPFSSITSDGSVRQPVLSSNGEFLAFVSKNPSYVDEVDSNFEDDVLVAPLTPSVGFEVSAVRVPENGGTLQLVVKRSGPTVEPLSIEFGVGLPGDSAARQQDFTALASGVLSWAAGNAIDKLIPIQLLDDSLGEDSEELSIILKNASEGAKISAGTMRVVIDDNETISPRIRTGHGLKIVKIISRGTNWSTGQFGARVIIRNPNVHSSYPGAFRLEFTGRLNFAQVEKQEIYFQTFPPIPPRSEVSFEISTNVGNQPDGMVYLKLFENSPVAEILQDSAYAAGYKDNGTQPPSGGTIAPDLGKDAPDFVAPQSTLSISGVAQANENSSPVFTATVTTTDSSGTTAQEVTATWTTSVFSITPGGVLNLGEVKKNSQVVVTARVNINGQQITANKAVQVKNVPSAPEIISVGTAVGTRDKPFKFSVIAVHEATSYEATNLPAGLEINAATGLISGVPNVTGAFVVQVTAQNELGIDSETLNIEIYEPSPLTVVKTGEGSITAPFPGSELRDVGRTYSLTAKPAAGFLFEGWHGDIESISTKLAFVMVPNLSLEARFVQNPFLTRSGNYSGLLFSDPTAHASSGKFQIKLAKSGAFSGRVIVAGKAHPVKGQLHSDGSLPPLVIPRKGQPELTISLQLNLVGPEQTVTGTLSDGVISSILKGGRVVTDAADLAGQYDIAPSEAGEIPGVTSGVISISKKGATRIRGRLSDGTAFSAGGPIVSGDVFPLYTGLYKGKGSLFSLVMIRSTATSDLDGEVHWFRPANPNQADFQDGWPNGITITLTGTK